MNSRERIRAALNHQPTDRIPIDIGGMGSTGISAIAYNKLKNKLGINTPTTIYDIYQQLGWVEPQVREELGGDVFQIHKLRGAFDIKRDKYKDGQMLDGTPCLVPNDYSPICDEDGNSLIVKDGITYGKRAKNGLYFDYEHLPYANVETVEDIDNVPLDYFTQEDLNFIEQKAQDAYKNTDKALLFDFGGNILSGGQNSWGYEKFFVEMAINPELVHYYLERLTNCHLSNLKNSLDRIGKYIDVINFCDDLGTQQAPQISVQMYREMIKPYHKKQFQFVKKNLPNVKVFLHSCGAIEPLIPDLIDAGVDILNPVQISASNMDPVALKNKYGKNLVFWGGGADMQTYVNTASVEEIKLHVNKLINIFSKDSGFVFSQVHNIQADVSPEKILAIYNTAKNY